MGDENEKIVRIPGETLVIKFSPDEATYREKYLPDPSKLTDEKLVCTVCSTPLATDVHKGKSIFVHRVLNVLVCEVCYNFYGDGNFSVDEDGDDKYCRWCGQGGTLFLCSTCSCAFCQKCVKQNLKQSVIAELEKDDWKCYICNPRPLFGTRTICWGAEQLNQKGKEKERERLKKLEEKKKEETERRSRKDSSDEESSKKKRKRSIDSDSTSPEVMPSKKAKRNQRTSQNGFGKGRRRRKSSSEESSEEEKKSKSFRSRTTSNKKNVSYAESSSEDESDSRQKNKKKIKKKKLRDSSDESSNDKKTRTNRKSIKKANDSSEDSSDEEKTKNKKSVKKKKSRDGSDLSSDEKKSRKKPVKNKKDTSSDDSSEDKKKKSSQKHKKNKNESSEEDSESLKKDKKSKKSDGHFQNTLESDSDSKKSKSKGDKELTSKIVSIDSQAEDKIVKKRIKLAVVWLSNAAKDIAELGSLISVRATKFKQKKINSDSLKTYEDVIKTVNKVKQLITGVHSNYDHIEKNLEAQLKPWKILTGIEETETKSTADGNNKEMEEADSKPNSQSILEPCIKDLSNDSCNTKVNDNETPCTKQENCQSEKTSEDNIEAMELQWSGDDSDNDKQNVTKDLISKANETLDKMEEEESPKVAKSLIGKKTEENLTVGLKESDALSKESQRRKRQVSDSLDCPVKGSLSEDDDKNTDSNKKEPVDSEKVGSNQGKHPNTPDLDKKEDPTSVKKNCQKKNETPEKSTSKKSRSEKEVESNSEKDKSTNKKSRSEKEVESDADKDVFSKKNNEENVFKKESRQRRQSKKKVTRKSVKEQIKCTEELEDSQCNENASSLSGKSTPLKTSGEKIKDKCSNANKEDKMKLIAPLGSDLSEEELETTVMPGSKRKGKDSSEENDNCEAPKTKTKNLSIKKKKTSDTLDSKNKTKKSETPEQGVSKLGEGPGKESNKKKKSTKANLSSDSEDESERTSKEKPTNHKTKKESVKNEKGKRLKKNSDSDESVHETVDNHDKKKKKKLSSHKKKKLHSKQSLSSDSEDIPEKDDCTNEDLTERAVEEKSKGANVTNGKKKENSCISPAEEGKDNDRGNKKIKSEVNDNRGKPSSEKTKRESSIDNLVENEAQNESAAMKFANLGSSSDEENAEANVKPDAKKNTASSEISMKNPPKNLLLLDSSDEENETQEDQPNNLPTLLSSDEEKEDKKKSSVASGSIENLSSAESSEEEIFRKKKTKTKESRSSDSDFEESNDDKKRKKRKLVRCASSSNNSEDSNDENGEKSKKSSGKSPGKGRKNIKKIKKDLADSTKEAAEEEKERRKRIEDRQKLFNQVFEVKASKTLDKLVLDFDPDNKKELLSVNKDLVAKMKPHQAKGVKFMWDSCFESINDCKKKKGSGCILAHCMGLGKTFQVISLVHTLLMNEDTQVRTVMVVCPLSTVLNWFNEFDKWLENIEGGSSIDVYHLTRLKSNPERARELRHWQQTGGVLIMGYEMFRNLTAETTKKFRAKMKKDFQETLVDPGADIIVCDEGHMLKNEQTALSKAMGRVRTLRRIVLTGTPMQNNLVEYHCMVQFVKPNLLGTKKEFLNRFVNPITNGQFVDSTERDVSIMKRRAHVLHKMLEGLVQRFDYNVLTPFLPPKHEYVVSICLSELQVKMYQHYLDNYSQRSDKEKAGSRLFQDWQALGRIWTHPRVVKISAEKAAEKKAMMEESDDEEGSLKDFIDDSEAETTSDSDNQSVSSGGSIKSNTKKRRVVQTRRKTRSNARNDAHLESEEEENAVNEIEETPEKETAGAWWSEFLKPEDLDDIRHSGKLMLLFGILKESEMIEDKVLVFSQSLFSLDLIEYFLDKIDAATQEDRLDESLGKHQGTWSKGLDYFRLDGSTSSDNRNLWCKAFNREDNPRARLFLISTRAGGLGINLTAANRVIIFDASWNPSHDVQSIFRVYRFGQKKPCYVYRFIAHGTMEEKVYDRQVAKQSISNRVVDEQQVHRHFTSSDLNELYTFTPPSKPEDRPIPALPKDVLMAEILAQFKEWIEKYHEHDSLLENVAEEELNEEERKLAWEDYETEKKRGFAPNYANNTAGPANNSMQMQIEILRQNLKTKYPNMTEPELQNALIQQVSILMRQQHMIQQQQRMAQQQYQQQQMAARVMQMRQEQQQAQLQMKQMYQKVPAGVFMNQQGSAQPSLLSSFLNMPSRSNAQVPRMSTPYPQMTPNFKEMEAMRQKYLQAKKPGVVITEVKDDEPKPSSS